MLECVRYLCRIMNILFDLGELLDDCLIVVILYLEEFYMRFFIITYIHTHVCMYVLCVCVCMYVCIRHFIFNLKIKIKL